ncbi:MAG TPA: ABC transporter ATP-binding protein [Acholeplasmataceae bacterium]|jgi:ATP-binding cassette subfamily B multidrug efflux pump|nr:ABC transporter ATP-binding protein [Acholeplasmataceae bacterium]
MIFGKNINRYYLKYLHYIIIGILALLVVDIYQLKIPEIVKNVIDGVNEGWLTMGKLRAYLEEILLIALIMFVGRFLWRFALFGNGVRIETDLRDKMFVHMEGLSQRYFQENKTGALMALFTNDLQTIRRAFGVGTLMLIDALFLGTLAFRKMIKINLTLTIIASIPLIIIAVCGMIIGRYMRKKFSAMQKSFANISDFTQESFSGIAVIKAFVKEAKELLAFRKINKDYREKNVEYVKAAVLLQILIGLFINSIVVIILGYGGFLVYNSYRSGGNFSIGTLAAFISYFTSMIWPMMAIANLINLRSQGAASLKRINALLNTPKEIQDSKDAISFPIQGKIEFKDFSFAYPDGQQALQNISFRLNSGESLGIIGRTGCGKTTLVDVLLRIHNVEEGRVFIDDVDLMKIKVRDLREAIAYVPQDNFLFSDTIANNINFSKKELDLEEVTTAAKLADVHNNIAEFSEGYNTVLGERGTTVSGGQKQRISIARALLKDAQILILDDSVSAVDTNTEKTILENLRKIRKEKTTILIAHRISTIESMDKIALLDEGRLIGFGSHEELLAGCPEYQKMVELQRLEDEIGGVDGE